MDLDHAVEAHSQWKIKLRGAISKQETLDTAAISSDDHCPFGQWLHGDARHKLGNMKSYAECVEKHATFHKEAGKVAQAINGRHYAEAELMLNGSTSFAAASSAVGVAIMHLKKESAA